jgi:hypothetical protein
MPSTEISDLASDSSLTGTEELVVNEAGTTKKATLAQVQTFLGQNIFGTLGSSPTSVSATMVEATALSKTLATGTYIFEHRAIFQSSDITNGVRFGVNFTGSQTAFVVEGTIPDTSAVTGGGTYLGTVTVEPGFRMRTGGAGRAPSTTATILLVTGTDVVDVNCMGIIRGLIVVSASGDLELWWGSELSTPGTQTLRTESSVWITKVA